MHMYRCALFLNKFNNNIAKISYLLQIVHFYYFYVIFQITITFSNSINFDAEFRNKTLLQILFRLDICILNTKNVSIMFFYILESFYLGNLRKYQQAKFCQFHQKYFLHKGCMFVKIGLSYKQLQKESRYFNNTDILFEIVLV